MLEDRPGPRPVTPPAHPIPTRRLVPLGSVTSIYQRSGDEGHFRNGKIEGVVVCPRSRVGSDVTSEDDVYGGVV